MTLQMQLAVVNSSRPIRMSHSNTFKRSRDDHSCCGMLQCVALCCSAFTSVRLHVHGCATCAHAHAYLITPTKRPGKTHVHAHIYTRTHHFRTFTNTRVLCIHTHTHTRTNTHAHKHTRTSLPMLTYTWALFT